MRENIDVPIKAHGASFIIISLNNECAKSYILVSGGEVSLSFPLHSVVCGPCTLSSQHVVCLMFIGICDFV